MSQRPDALSSDDGSRLGEAVAPQWLIAVVVCIAVLAAVLVAREIRQHGTTVVTGLLEAESVVLRSTAPGVVISVDAAIGDVVKPGQVVASLRADRRQSREELKHALAKVEQDYEVARARFEFEIGSRTREIDGDIHELEMRAAALKAEHYAAEMERVAWRDVLDGSLVAAGDSQPGAIQQTGYSSSILDEQRVVEVFGESNIRPVKLSTGSQFQAIIKHERASAQADACESQLELCTKRLAVLTDQRDQLAKQFEKTIGLPAIEADKVRLKQQLDDYDALTELTSPAHGTVVRVAQPGSACDGETLIVELADNARRRVQAVIPANVAIRYQVGDQVDLTFPTGDERSGKLSFIAPAGKNGIPVLIEQFGKRWPRLSLGCQVDVTVR